MQKWERKAGGIMLIILLIGMLFLPSWMSNREEVYAEESPVKQLQDLEQGEEILFAGQEWIVLEPDEGYILKKNSIGNMPFDKVAPWSDKFDPSDVNNIAYDLNTDYYQTFTSVQQAVIEPREWGIGSEMEEEDQETIHANIGLLSYHEWRKYSRRYNSAAGFLANPPTNMWTRTPYPSSRLYGWRVRPNGQLASLDSLLYMEHAIRPVLTLDAELFISDENKVILTEVVFEPNGSETWAQAHQTAVTVENDLGAVSNVQYAWSAETVKPSEGWETFDEAKASIQTPDEATGVYYLHMQGEDAAGRGFDVHSNAFSVDNEPPTAPEIYAPTEWTKRETVEIIAGEDDDSGVAQTAYRIGENEEWVDWQELDEDGMLGIEEEGEMIVQAKTVDNAGNESEITERTVKIDRTAPNITISMTQGDEEAAYEHDTWTNQAVHLSVQAEDHVLEDLMIRINNEEIENIADFQHNFSLSEEGTYTIEVSAADQAGNEAEEERIIKIDYSAPSAPLMELDPEGWTNKEKGTVTIEAGADEANGSGIAVTEYRVGETGDWVIYENSFDVEAEGETTVYAQTMDQAGNVSERAEAIVQIDQTAPAIEFSADGNAQSSQAASTKVTVMDAYSGVFQLDYLWSTEDTEQGEGAEWESFDNEEEIIKEDGDGEWYLHIQATDHAGNVANAVTEAFILDNTPPDIPQIEADTTNWTNRESVTVVIAVEEAEAEIEYQLNGVSGEWLTYENEFAISADGETTIFARAVDKAENVSEIAKKTVKIDHSAPSAPMIEIDPEGWTNQEKGTVTIEAGRDEANGSGVSATEYRVGETGDWVIYENSFDVEAEGETIVYARTIDQAGNSSEIVQATVKIDRTNPNITISMTQGDEAADYEHDTWTNQVVHLSVEAVDQVIEDLVIRVNDDVIENIANFQHAFFISKEGTYTIEATASDQAGNEVKEERIVKIDQSAPSAPMIELDPEDWTNEEVTVTIQAEEDGESGVSHTEYHIGEKGEWKTYEEVLSIEAEGETTIYARSIDQAGNSSEVESTVVRIDRTAPELTLFGDSPMYVLYGDIFDDPGYEVTDNLDERIADEVDVRGDIDTEEIGIYTIIYSVKDHAGNETTQTRVVHVVDEEQPVITLQGDNPFILEVGSDYEEPGATAEDNANGDISDQIEISENIDTTKLGTYHVVYQVKDNSGNKTEITRTVEIVDSTDPEINLNGEAELTMELGDSYEEAGATAEDNYDGDISDRIEITGNLDVNQIGTYQVTYLVEDSSNNSVSITRTVHVIDTTAPTDVIFEAVEVTTEAIVFTFSAEDLRGINEYILSRDEVEIARIAGGETTYTDELIEAGITYQYELIAVDASDNTSTPVTIEVTTPLADGGLITVEYVDEEGNELADSEELTGKLGESYEAESKEIKGYELIEIPDNANGEFTEEAQTVTYVYVLQEEKPILGEPVTVEHVDEEGTELLSPEELIGNIGDSYQTHPANIAGYELKQTPDNANGTFTNEAQTVIYVYTLVEREIEGTIIIDYVNEAGQSIADREIQAGKVGETYETESKAIEGYELVETPDNASGEFTEEAQIVIYVYAPIEEEPALGAPVMVKYVDEAGEELIPSAELIGKLGESYQTEAIEIGSYEIVQIPDNATGEFTEEAQTVTYVYAPMEEVSEQGTIMIAYVNKEGQSLVSRETQTGKAGEAYTTEAKAIEGYELVEIPDNATGVFTEETQTITYVYVPIKEEPILGEAVTVRYVDEAGEKLIPSDELIGNLGDAYKTEEREIEGYQLIETPQNAVGTFTEEMQTVTYVYKLEKQEEPKEPEIPKKLEIILGEPRVEVFPGILITIKDTQTTIQLPDDLPAGTLLQVLAVQVEVQEGLKQAGEVYDFHFTYPDGQEDYNGDFILTMGVDETRNQVALYHYQEAWQRIGGTLSGNTITATVSDFSMYGVFMEEVLEPEPPVKEEPEEKEPKQEPKGQETEGKKPAKEPKEEKPSEEEDAILPATATNQYNWLIVGITLMLVGNSLWFIRRKRNYKED